MHEHMYPLTEHAHVDLERGAIILFKEKDSPYFPAHTYGTLYDAVLGGAPDVYFPIFPGRAQIGFVLPVADLPLSAGNFERRNEIGVDMTIPVGVAHWIPDETNAYGFRMLQLYYKTRENKIHSLTLLWNQTQWDIHESSVVDGANIKAHDRQLFDSLSLLQSI